MSYETHLDLPNIFHGNIPKFDLCPLLTGTPAHHYPTPIFLAFLANQKCFPDAAAPSDSIKGYNGGVAAFPASVIQVVQHQADENVLDPC